MSLKVDNLCLAFGGKTILENLCLEVDAGEIVGLSGDNGTGKSTLCKCLAGFVPFGAEISGTVTLDGKNLLDYSQGERAKQVGIIFQNPDNRLFSTDVVDEIVFGMENLCLPRAEMTARLEYALNICGIQRLRGAKTAKLSGGEKQLVAVASVIVQQPKFIIADEITTHLDADGKRLIRQFLRAYATAGGGVVWTTHSAEELVLCTRTLTLLHRTEE